MAQLYLIATPLGNRFDITLRALELFKTLPVLFAEDTREIGKLLEMHGVARLDQKHYSYANHNMKAATEKALEFLANGLDVGFVSDRGTPGISDPGFLLVKEARDQGFNVVPVPGASSVAAALCVSGFRADQYLFQGFLPTKNGDRDRLWKQVEGWLFCVCFFESPKRVRETLGELKARFPQREIFVAREMTKIHETFYRGELAGFEPEGVLERGEFTVVLGPALCDPPTDAAAWEAEVALRVASEKEWAKKLAERHGVSSSTLYNALQLAKKR